MKRFSLLFTLLLALAGAAEGQSLMVQPPCVVSQGAGQQLSYACPFTQPNAQGNGILVFLVGNVAKVSDSNNNSYLALVSTPQLSAWAATGIVAGQNTVTVTLNAPGALQEVAAEYASVVSVTNTLVASGSGTAPVSAPLAAQAGNTIIGFGSQWTNSFQAPSSAGTGFTMEHSGPLWVEDETVSTSGTFPSEATYSGSVNWYTAAIVLNLVPLPPPVSLAITNGPIQPNGPTIVSEFVYDNGTPVLGQAGGAATVLEQEGNNSASWVAVGNLAIAPSGAISGSVTVNPNFTVEGSVYLEVAIAGQPIFGPFAIDPRAVEQGSTGFVFSVTLFSSILTPKAVSFGLVP